LNKNEQSSFLFNQSNSQIVDWLNSSVIAKSLNSQGMSQIIKLLIS